MIRHVMADGTRRDSIEGCVIPREISESVLTTIFRKDRKNGNSNTTRVEKK